MGVYITFKMFWVGMLVITGLIVLAYFVGHACGIDKMRERTKQQNDIPSTYTWIKWGGEPDIEKTTFTPDIAGTYIASLKDERHG